MNHPVINAPTAPLRSGASPSHANGRSLEVAVMATRSPSADDSQTDDSPTDAPSLQKKGPIGRLLNVVTGGMGTLFVLAIFAALFFYGHHNDWRIPKFAELTGSSVKERNDWCEEHSVPESLCVECDPSIMPQEPDYGWCPVHGVHNCLWEHPELAQLKEVPEVLPADLQRAARALAIGSRKENNSECGVYRTRIQFESVESVRQAGVDVELVERQPIVESIAGSGEIVYDPTRLASLASRVPGSVWLVDKNVGDQVRRGEILALVDAVEVGELKTRLLRALAEEKLQQLNVSRLNDAGVAVAGARVLDAQAAYAKAQADVLSAEQSLRNLGLPVQVSSLRGMPETAVMQHLRLLGIPDALRSRLGHGVATANLLPIVSPMTGVIVNRTATPGEVVDPTRILFQVADLRQMWLLLNIPLERVDQLAVGQIVQFRADGSRQQVTGRLDWISTSVDAITRMVQCRVLLPNLDGHLRNETFGTGQVILRQEPDAIVIPKGSSHWEGCCQVVFVRNRNFFDSPESPKVFHVRSVRLGASNDRYTEVISGVLPGEVIATAGSDVLRAQLLKNNLGEGCDCVAE